MKWKDLYWAVLVEVDPAKLLLLIHDTEAAMMEYSASVPPISSEEQQAIRDATSTMHILRNLAVEHSVLDQPHRNG